MFVSEKILTLKITISKVCANGNTLFPLSTSAED